VARDGLWSITTCSHMIGSVTFPPKIRKFRVFGRPTKKDRLNQNPTLNSIRAVPPQGNLKFQETQEVRIRKLKFHLNI
jgi:hypothetical protein